MECEWQLEARSLSCLVDPRRFRALRLGCINGANMNITQLARRNKAWCAHHKVLRLLVQREGNDFADVGFIRKQHDDTVDTRG